MDPELRDLERRTSAGEAGARAGLLRARVRAGVGRILVWAGFRGPFPTGESQPFDVATGAGTVRHGQTWCDAVLGLDDLAAVISGVRRGAHAAYLVDLATGESVQIQPGPSEVSVQELATGSPRAHSFIGPNDPEHTHLPFESHCRYCDGGLQFCKVCRLGEGELTTECPGYPSADEHGAEVYAGRVDFVGGRWVPGRSPSSPPRRAPVPPGGLPDWSRMGASGRSSD